MTAAGGMGMLGMPMAPASAVADALDALSAVEGPVGFNVVMPFLDVEVVEVAAARSAPGPGRARGPAGAAQR